MMVLLKIFKNNLIFNYVGGLTKEPLKYFSTSVVNHGAKTKVGFIGLGNMGGPMALNLLNKGHDLIVYDVNSEAVESLRASGATCAATPADVAKEADSIVTMLPNSHHVRSCYSGENGIFEGLQPGTLLLDSSTIDPTVSKEVSAIAIKKGALFMDTPVSGGVNAAKGGTLTFMVGGNKSEFEAAKLLLNHMGKNIVYCGEVGSGQAAKICNNMLLAITMIGTSETMNLGIKLGLDPKLLASILNTSSGRCWSSDTYNPVPGVMENVPSSNNYQGGFGTALMTKDLGLAQAAATDCQAPTPLGSLSHQIYRIMTNSDFSTKDFSSVFEFLANQNSQK